MSLPRRGVGGTVRSLARAIGVAATTVVLIACGTSEPSFAATAPVASPASSAGIALPSSLPGRTIPPDVDPCVLGPGATAPTTGIALDESLIETLPAEVGGIGRLACPGAAAEIAADAALAADVSAIAIALYVSQEDQAVVTVVRPRPAEIDAAWFRAWRDSFDTRVCERAGGVDLGRSEFQVEELTVHRATCAEGVATYHAYLATEGILVSLQGSGPLDLGRSIVASLAE